MLSKEWHFRPVSLGRLVFRAASLSQAAEWFLTSELRPGKDARLVVARFTNAFCVAVASQNERYADVLNGPGQTFPDGFAVAVSLRLFGGEFAHSTRRVRGPSFFRESLRRGVELDASHVFIGSSAETLESLQRVVQSSFVGLRVRGLYAPPMISNEAELLDDIIRNCDMEPGDVVWVGLGTPKQDFISLELASRLGVRAAGVGAAIDFVAGTTAEAPHLIQITGMEWLFRLLTEPRRLWRRYLVGNFQFARYVFASAIYRR